MAQDVGIYRPIYARPFPKNARAITHPRKITVIPDNSEEMTVSFAVQTALPIVGHEQISVNNATEVLKCYLITGKFFKISWVKATHLRCAGK